MRFDTRKEIVAFIKTEKFKNIGKHCSMVNPNSSSGNVVHLKCDDCECCYYRCHHKKDGWCVQYAMEEHYNISGDYRIDCIPNGSMSAQECLDNDSFGCMLSQKKTTKHPVRVSSDSLADLMRTQGASIAPNASAIKRAAASHRIQVLKHESSIQKMQTFLVLMKLRNPSMTYDYFMDADNKFESVLIVMPGASAAWETCHKICSIDSAHGKDIVLDSSTHQFLKRFIFTVASGYTVNNTMIVYAISVSYHENILELKKLARAMLAAGMVVDALDVILMSDRGSAVVSMIHEVFELAFHRPCPKHITRNLKHLKLGHFIPDFWKACLSTTLADYTAAMDQIRSKSQKCYDYLNDKCENFGLYHLISRGLVGNDVKSDNMVEQVFSWLIDLRDLSPYFSSKW
jgi:hypothetical protein